MADLSAITSPAPGSSVPNGAFGSNMGGLGMLYQQLQNQPLTQSQQAMAPAQAPAAPADVWGDFATRGFGGDPKEFEANSARLGGAAPAQVRKLSLDQLNGLIKEGGWSNNDLASMMWSQPQSRNEDSGTYNSPADQSYLDMYDKLGGNGPGSDAARHSVQYDEFRQGLRDYQGQWGQQAAAAAPAAASSAPSPLQNVGTNFVHLNPLPYLKSMTTSPTPGSSVPNNTLAQISDGGAGAFGSLSPKAAPAGVDWNAWMNGSGPTGANNY